MRFLSWIVLIACFALSYFFGQILFDFAMSIFDWVSGLNIGWRVVVWIFGGSAFLGLLLAPFRYGPILAVSASEAVRESKKGTRYKVVSIFVLISAVIMLAANVVVLQLLDLSSAYMAIFSICVLVSARHLIAK